MSVKLNIGTLSNTISEYNNLINVLTNQTTNINATIKILTEDDWAGNLKEEFVEIHTQNQSLIEELKTDLEYMVNVLESEERASAVQLKLRCEGFVDCIKRLNSNGTTTNVNNGIIKLGGNKLSINNSIKNSINDYYPEMKAKFEEIMKIANGLEYTSIGISDYIWNANLSLNNQATSLKDFNESFNIYCNKVSEMEANTASALSKISGITNSSLLNGNSFINTNGEINVDSIKGLMLKNQDELSEAEKEVIAYALNTYSNEELQNIINDITTDGKQVSDNSLYSIIARSYPEVGGENFSLGSNTFGLGLGLGETTSYGIMSYKISAAKSAAKSLAKTNGYAKTSVWLTNEIADIKMLYGAGKYGPRIAGQMSKFAKATPYISAAIDVTDDIINGEKASKIAADGIVDIAVYSAAGVLANAAATAATAAAIGSVGGPAGTAIGAAVGLGVGILSSIAIDGISIGVDENGDDISIKEGLQNGLSETFDSIGGYLTSWF